MMFVGHQVLIVTECLVIAIKQNSILQYLSWEVVGETHFTDVVRPKPILFIYVIDIKR